MIQLITDETNRYSKQEITPQHPDPFWYDVTPSEIILLLSLIFLMGIDIKPNYELYWSKLIHSPLYEDIIPLKRFKEIKRYLPFARMLDTITDIKQDIRNTGFMIKIFFQLSFYFSMGFIVRY